MNNKIVVVTGANAGIGRITALELAKKGAHVVMVCRNKERAEVVQQTLKKKSGNDNIDLMICDLASQASLKEFGQAFRQRYQQVDVLVNNAGGMFGDRILTEDRIEYTLALNHLGYFICTHYLVDLLLRAPDPRVVNVASEAHRLAKVDFDNLQGEKKYAQMANYGNSKLFNILFTRLLAKKMEGRMTVNCLHPGVVRTNFGRVSGSLWAKVLIPVGAFMMISPEKGAATSIYLASDPNVKENGEYFIKKKVKKTTKLGYNMQVAERLWEESLKLAGIAEFGVVK